MVALWRLPRRHSDKAIAKARKAKRLSQKELAALIVKDEDGGAISPQYLNDIEHDRRNPTSDYLIRRFAKVLDEEEGYLFVLAGKIPKICVAGPRTVIRLSRDSPTSERRSPNRTKRHSEDGSRQYWPVRATPLLHRGRTGPGMRAHRLGLPDGPAWAISPASHHG